MIPEEIIKSQSEYMQLFGADKESFAGGARWALEYIKSVITNGEKEALIKLIIDRYKIPSSYFKQVETCKHKRIEEIQGGQIERCLDCGETWG